jgi:hypothetical protein
MDKILSYLFRPVLLLVFFSAAAQAACPEGRACLSWSKVPLEYACSGEVVYTTYVANNPQGPFHAVTPSIVGLSVTAPLPTYDPSYWITEAQCVPTGHSYVGSTGVVKLYKNGPPP